MKLNRLIFIIDFIYWLAYIIGWFFRGASEIFNGLGELFRVVKKWRDRDDEGGDE